jgi:hypothetical protein
MFPVIVAIGRLWYSVIHSAFCAGNIQASQVPVNLTDKAGEDGAGMKLQFRTGIVPDGCPEKPR